MGKENYSESRINFIIAPGKKKDIERLARLKDMSLSEFMNDICDRLIKANTDKLTALAELQKGDVKFDDSTTKTRRTRKKNQKSKEDTATVRSEDNGGDDNAEN